MLLASICHISQCFIGSGTRGAVGVRAPTKSYLHQVRCMRQVHDLGVHDRLIDQKKMWPSQLLFKTSKYSVFR